MPLLLEFGPRRLLASFSFLHAKGACDFALSAVQRFGRKCPLKCVRCTAFPSFCRAFCHSVQLFHHFVRNCILVVCPSMLQSPFYKEGSVPAFPWRARPNPDAWSPKCCKNQIAAILQNFDFIAKSIILKKQINYQNFDKKITKSSKKQ